MPDENTQAEPRISMLTLMLLAIVMGQSVPEPAASQHEDAEQTPAVAPPESASERQTDDCAGCRVCSDSVDWAKIPPVRPLSRLGMPPLFPKGPGFYTLTDQALGRPSTEAPNAPWGTFAFTPLSSFDLDFRYLDDPKNTQHDIFDPLKRIHVCDDWMFSVGGQTWIRTMNEVDSRLTTTNNEYQLLRTREYLDIWYRDRIRIFSEFIYAESFNFDLNPLPIDINRADMLNLFGEVKLFGDAEHRLYARIGRQEMLYGSQRLISPLEWANTRRTFEGAKLYYQSKDWDIDLFWVQPVRVNRDYWDNVDNNQNLAGAWASRKLKGGVWDSYYLFLDNTNPTAVGEGGDVGGQSLHTLGTRVFNKWNQWLFETELMLQLGSFSNQTKVAASTPVGLGYDFEESTWKHQVWVYYDWASGDRDPGQGSVNGTFNQLFPFGHYYFGYLDLVGRQNTQDAYAQWAFFPENWMTCLVQFHNFWLASDQDALYSAAGVPLRRDATGAAGNFVGHELDLFVSMQLSRHLNFSVGWSKLFAGDFIARTGPDVSPELFYTQMNYRW